jgi:hypothetical protein
VCWEHNWPECPLEVLELKSVMARVNKELDREMGNFTNKILPLINADDSDRKSGDPVIARDRVIENQEGLPRINADERGSEEQEE